MRRLIGLCVLALACREEPIARAAPSAPASKCPEGMVYVPGGTFTMGFSEAMERSNPYMYPSAMRHPVTLTRPYCMDQTEVTAAAYRKCVAAGTCRRNNCNARWDDRLDHPMNCVNWTEAETYCGWAGKRLPTEAEWEFAARGPKGYRHPWGNSKPNDRKLWYSGTTRRGFDTAPVGTHPDGASPFGAHDMEGNVAEWVADWDGRLTAVAQTDPMGPARGTMRVIKGAAMDSGILFESDVGERYAGWPNEEGAGTHGFRCARTATTADSASRRTAY